MNRAVVKSTSPRVSWCALDDNEVLARLQSRVNGLTSREAADRLGQFGPNRLPSKPPPPLA